MRYDKVRCKCMRISSKARNTHLASTAHVRPDCHDFVAILSTAILESKSSGKNWILTAFFEQFFDLVVNKLLLPIFQQFFFKIQERALPVCLPVCPT